MSGGDDDIQALRDVTIGCHAASRSDGTQSILHAVLGSFMQRSVYRRVFKLRQDNAAGLNLNPADLNIPTSPLLYNCWKMRLVGCFIPREATVGKQASPAPC